MAFKVGDKVIEIGHEDGGEQVVKFGPYTAVSGGVNRYVVERQDGFARELAETRIKAALELRIGDIVRHNTEPSTNYEIVYGPFSTIGGDGRYLIKNSEGIHRYMGSDSLTLVKDDPIRVGDRVRILRETRTYLGEYAGREGVIREIDSSDGLLPYYVDFGNTAYWVYEVEKI